MSKTVGQIAYEAYGANRDWKTVSGAPMPGWAEQRPEISAAWEASAAAVPAPQSLTDLAESRRAALVKALDERDDLRAKLAEMAAERTRYQVMADGAARERDAAIRERDAWKANHDIQRDIKRAALVRADLPIAEHPERTEFRRTMARLESERDDHAATIARLREALCKIAQLAPGSRTIEIAESIARVAIEQHDAALAANPEARDDGAPPTGSLICPKCGFATMRPGPKAWECGRIIDCGHKEQESPDAR